MPINDRCDRNAPDAIFCEATVFTSAFHEDGTHDWQNSKQYTIRVEKDALQKEAEVLAENPENRATPEHPTTISITYFHRTYVGRCLFETERNGYDDSDFYMTVWDDETDAPKSICFATTRGYCSFEYGSSPDATDEVKAKYAAWQERIRVEHEKARIEAEKKMPKPGRRVRVTGGRKVAKGTEAEVFWYGKDKFDRNARYRVFDNGIDGYRIGIVLPDGSKQFVNAANVEVVQA